jgi:hypothetical protein
MPVTASMMLIDGDTGFVRVDNKRPPNMLEPGVAPDAQNIRMDNGQARPRYGVGCQAWGVAGVNIIPSNAVWSAGAAPYYRVTGLVPGQYYYFIPPSNYNAPQFFNITITGASPLNGPCLFQAPANGVTTTIEAQYGNPGDAMTAQIIRLGAPLGYGRFTAPDTTDNCVLVTGDWRDQAGEDGGHGRAWRITPGNIPIQIPMNGHDAWDTVRLVAVMDGVLMLRGNRAERHYFGTAAVKMQGPASIPATSSRYRASNVAYLNITAHGLSTGMYVTITGLGGTGYNLTNVQVTKVTANQISYPDTGGNEGSSGSPVTDTGGALTLVGGPLQLNLNTVPGWNNGDLVQFAPATGGSAIYGNQPPAAGAQYYVNSVGGTLGQPAASADVVLYLDAACTQPLSVTTNSPAPNGSFYLERQAVSPGPYGNGAPTLLMQGASGQTPFQTGFLAAPLAVAITGTANSIATAPNHRLVPGDAVVVTGLTSSSSPLASPVYANPLSSSTVQFYATQLEALAASNGAQNNTGLVALDTPSQTGTMVKQSASGVPIPPAREGIYFLQRAILLNGVNNVLISDPLDPLHFTPMSSSLTGNIGENQQITNFQPLGVDTLLINMPNFILALYNLSQASSQWLLREITRQYGMVAPLASVHQGPDEWGFGRSGVVSITKTEFGELSGVDMPVSDPIPNYINQVDWPFAYQACGENWNNRTFFAVPFKGQTGSRTNNAVLVFNALNKFFAVQQGQQGDELVGAAVQTSERPDAWEGVWSGPNLQPVDFARLTVNGEERLTWVNANGTVCWFTDDFTDMGAAIQTSLTPRAYYGGRTVLALVVETNWDTFNPSISITAISPGYNETYQIVQNLTYDRTQYLVSGPTGNDFSQPNRADYSMIPDSGLYTAGVPFDVHQNITEKWRLRVRDRNPQIVIVNTQGSCRINSIVMKAAPAAITASRQT